MELRRVADPAKSPHLAGVVKDTRTAPAPGSLQAQIDNLEARLVILEKYIAALGRADTSNRIV